MIECCLDRTLIPPNLVLAEDIKTIRHMVKEYCPFDFVDLSIIVSKRLNIPENRVQEALWCMIDSGEISISHDWKAKYNEGYKIA